MSKQKILGQVIDDSFQILSQLGEGGFAEVYLALQIHLKRKVAIKFLRVNLAENQEWQIRFRREGKILGSLQHTNIVKCFSFGLWQDKLPYLVFEHLQGVTLKQLIIQRGKMHWRYVLKLAREICLALAYAHSHSIVHRDLKPENIMVLDEEPEPHIKVLDFGLSAFSNLGELRSDVITQTGELIGSTHYMSPEQCSGQKLDQRADIYSLGCIMYEALTGMRPFDGDTPISIIHKHLKTPAKLPSTLVEEIPQTVEYVIFKAIAKNREQRYSSAQEMSADIVKILQSETDLKLQDIAPSISNDLQIHLSRRKTNKWQKTALICCLLGIASSFAVFVFSDPGPAALFRLYAGILAPAKQSAYLESQADLCMEQHRFLGAEQLYKNARAKVAQRDLSANIRLLSKLALSSFASQQKENSLQYAEQCLRIACDPKFKFDRMNSDSIIRAANAIEKIAPPGDSRLDWDLTWLMSNADPPDVNISVCIASQSLEAGDRKMAEKRVHNLAPALVKSEVVGNNSWIVRLIDSAEKRASKWLSFRKPLDFALNKIREAANNGSLPARTAKGVLDSLIEAIVSEDSGTEQERANLAAFVLSTLGEPCCPPDFYHTSTNSLQKLADSNSSRLLRSEAAMLTADFECFNGNLVQVEKYSKLALSLLRTNGVNEIDKTKKTQIFQALAYLIKELPYDSPEKRRLILFYLSEATAQSIQLISSDKLVMASAFFDKAGVSGTFRPVLMKLLSEVRENRKPYRIDDFSALCICARVSKEQGDQIGHDIIMNMLEEAAKSAPCMDLSSYYKYKSEELSKANPSLAKHFADLHSLSLQQQKKHYLNQDEQINYLNWKKNY